MDVNAPHNVTVISMERRSAVSAEGWKIKDPKRKIKNSRLLDLLILYLLCKVLSINN